MTEEEKKEKERDFLDACVMTDIFLDSLLQKELEPGPAFGAALTTLLSRIMRTAPDQKTAASLLNACFGNATSQFMLHEDKVSHDSNNILH
jgi:hypothetical protein